MDKKEISLVIGAIYQDLNELVILLNQLDSNVDYLKEVICVVSGVNTFRKKQNLSILNKTLKIKIIIISLEEIVMPGAARNIGILRSKCPYICFLDSHPLPDKNWLSNSIRILEDKKLRGVFGSCKYIGINDLEKCFIAATFGNKPLYTLPGTLIEKDLLNEIGFFIPNVRSGEDAEWRSRAELFHPKIKQKNLKPLLYKGLKGKNIYQLLKKWYVYYKSTYLNGAFHLQRIFYISFLIFFSVLAAYGWNDNVAGWDQDSFLYAPHISKIVIIIIFCVYLFYRLVLLPKKKEVNIIKFNLIQFLKFSFISITLDFIKLIAFINHGR